MPINPENQLNYYSAKLLKEALIEMGYVFPKNITKKELIQFITNIIQHSQDISSSESDEEDEEIVDYHGIVFKCSYSE